MLADLSVRFRRLSEVVPHLLVGFVHHPLLVAGHPPRRAATETDIGTHQETMLTQKQSDLETNRFSVTDNL